jgi:hypothetical protein
MPAPNPNPRRPPATSIQRSQEGQSVLAAWGEAVHDVAAGGFLGDVAGVEEPCGVLASRLQVGAQSPRNSEQIQRSFPFEKVENLNSPMTRHPTHNSLHSTKESSHEIILRSCERETIFSNENDRV